MTSEKRGVNMEEEKTCGTCVWNDDLLCDLLGRLISDDDPACSRHEANGYGLSEKEDK